MPLEIEQGEVKFTILFKAPERSESVERMEVNEKEVSEKGDDEQYLTSWKLGLVTASLYLGTLLVAIDTTIISVAVPKISTVFRALDDIGWYGSAYLITVTACQPSFGKIYRFYDVKTVYLSSIVIFEGMI